MTFKKQEKKAKKYIREELEQVNSIALLPMEERVQALKDKFTDIEVKSEEEQIMLSAESSLILKDPVKNRLVHLFVSGQYTNTQIGRILGISDNTVSKWLKIPEIKEAIEKYQLEEDAIVFNSLKALRIKALKTMSELLEAENELVQLNASKDILDRTGHKAIEKKQVDINMTYEERLAKLIEEPSFVEVEVNE